MKLGKKGIIAIIAGVIFCAVATPLLAIFIPRLFQKSSISDLVENQVKPVEGNGDFINYGLERAKDEVSTMNSMQKVETIEQFASETIQTSDGMERIIDITISNILVDFFKNIKDSKSYTEKFDEWVDNINTSWDDAVSSYKDQHGSDWQFYFQLNELDPVGGNEIDWKRNQLFSLVTSEFDSIMQSGSFINLVNKNGQIVTDITESMLFDKDVIFNAVGQPCNIVFKAPAYQSSDEGSPPVMDPAPVDSFNEAIADFKSFVFDEYVKDKLPLVTSMVLFGQDVPATEEGDSNFFNVLLATNMNGGTSPVGTEASYSWQVFEPEVTSLEGTLNATAKYNMFVTDIQPNSQKKLILDSLGGAINIPVEYTTDSSTLYLINAKDVYDSTYTQYSAAAMYKLNNLLFGTEDRRVPTINGVSKLKKQGDTVNGGTAIVEPGLEIMSNFFRYDEPSNSATSPYYFALPEAVRKIINDNPTYAFDGIYNGAKSITDSVNILNSPFIMTRDEAGVHIIGIDRYDAIKSASTYEEKITEIKNTLLWRHLISNTTTTDGNNPSSTTGFTLDLNSDISSYYTDNRNELLIKYIISKETNPPTTNEEKRAYIFSDVYSNMEVGWNSATKKLITDEEKAVFKKYYDFVDYSSYSSVNSTIRQKFLDLQTSYVGKYFGTEGYDDAVVVNGIAGMLPYTRDITQNNVSLVDGVFDDVYGTYSNVAWHFSDNQIFKNTTLKTKENDFKQAALNYLNTMTANNPLVPKTLTYSSASYNQYLEVSTEKQDSTQYYASFGDRINDAIGSWITSSKVANIVYLQKAQAYLTDENAGINFTNFNFDNQNADTLPTSNETSLGFVNSRLQYALNLKDRFSEVTSTIQYSVGNWTTFNELYNLLVNNNTASLTNGYYSDEQVASLRNFLTLLYAFDYDSTTRSYNFTKFRDYLLDKTTNNGKAAYVWTTNERINFIQDYANQTIDEQFAFKSKMIQVSQNTYGYAYQDASKVAIKPVSTSPVLFEQDVTFNNKSTYWRFASPSPEITNTNNGYTGFLGMNFPGSTNADLDSTASSTMFSSSAKYYDDDTRTTSNIKGVLYNIASGAVEGRKKLDLEIDKIRNNTQKDRMTTWLFENFTLTNDNKEQAQSLRTRIDKSSVASEYIPLLKELAKLIIPDIAFERVTSQQLVNSTYSVQQPWKERYFGDTTSDLGSQVVVTQFNYDDVVKLFDTADENGNPNPDGQITEQDKGINWTVAASDGFLGASPEAFFISAIDWFNSNTLFTNVAFDNMREAMGKVTTFDRRLNDLFGESWTENYKEPQ